MSSGSIFKWQPGANSYTIPSNVAAPRRVARPDHTNGMTVRGVVIKTWKKGETYGSFRSTSDSVIALFRQTYGALFDAARDLTPPRGVSVYCDVLVYSGFQGMRYQILPRCMVLQQRSGLHEGSSWEPRETTGTISGAPLDLNKLTSVFDMNGDHVLISFIDQDPGLPIILGTLPHPRQDTGHALDSENRTSEEVSSDPLEPRSTTRDSKEKFNGVKFGVDRFGNYSLDATHGYDGQTSPTGLEPRLPLEASAGVDQDVIEPYETVGGSVVIRSREGQPIGLAIDSLRVPGKSWVAGLSTDEAGADSTLSFAVQQQPLNSNAENGLDVRDVGPANVVTLGQGDAQAIIAAVLQRWWDDKVQPQLTAFMTHYMAHVHESAAPGSPTTVTVPPAPPVVFPALDPAMISAHLKFTKNGP